MRTGSYCYAYSYSLHSCRALPPDQIGHSSCIRKIVVAFLFVMALAGGAAVAVRQKLHADALCFHQPLVSP